MRKYLFFALCGPVVLLLLFAARYARAEDTARLTILYTTDTHGHVVSDGNTLGLDAIAGIKRVFSDALLVDVGDFLHGSDLANFDEGRSIVKLMKAAGYYAAALGNHDFAYSSAVLMERKAEAEEEPDSFSFLSANVKEREGGRLFAPSKSAVLDGVKVCFFGLTTPMTAKWGTPASVEGLVFTDEIAATRRQVNALREEGCDVVVALSHIGSDGKVKVTSEIIGRKTSGIDVIIDGHSHVVLDQRIPDGPLLVSSGEWGKHLGKLDITFDRREKRLVDIKNTLLSVGDMAKFTPDPLVADLLAKVEDEADRKLSRVRGEAAQPLPFDEDLNENSETPLGDFIADSLRAECGTDIGLINGGYIEGGIPQGPVTGRDLMNAVRFGGKAYRMRLTGEEIREMMELSVRKLPKARKYFLQVSGLVARVEQGNRSGNRVAFLALEDGTSIDDDKTYSVGMNEYIAFGGDEYSFISEKPREECGVSVEEALARHLARTGARGYGKDRGERLVIVP